LVRPKKIALSGRLILLQVDERGSTGQRARESLV